MLAQTVVALEIDLLAVFMLTAGVGVFVAKVGRFPYTIALLLAGFDISAMQAVFGIQLFDLQLSHDLTLLVLPPLLFEGARRPTSNRSATASCRFSRSRYPD